MNTPNLCLSDITGLPTCIISDIARAYIATIESPIELVHNKAFNVGLTTENYQIRELATIVGEVVPHAGHFLVEDQPDYVNARLVRFLRDGE